MVVDLTTHGAGGLSALALDLAAEIEKAAGPEARTIRDVHLVTGGHSSGSLIQDGRVPGSACFRRSLALAALEALDREF